MIWTVQWAWDHDLRHVGYDVIADVRAAVVAFAERGEGELVPLDVPEDEPSLWKLPAPSGFALVRVDERALVLRVEGILPNVPLPRVHPMLDDEAQVFYYKDDE